MDLNSIQLTLRPRTPWEAADLGFAIARQWYWQLWLLWIIVASPFYIVFALVWPFGEWFGPSLAVWWFKPLFEPMLLFWLSRAIFNNKIGLPNTLKQWWSLVWPRSLPSITWRRFNPNRSFHMPITILEGSAGKTRSQRVKVLGRNQHVGGWLTVMGLIFETLIAFSMVLLVYALIPSELMWTDFWNFISGDDGFPYVLTELVTMGAMSIIAPFYVAAGFSLYLNRRSELEGWDIELGFRRILERRRGSSWANGMLVLAICIVLGFSGSPMANAQTSPDPDQARQTIEEVLNNPDFGEVKSRTRWRYIGDQKKQNNEDNNFEFFEWLLDVLEGFSKGFAKLAEILLWITLGVGLLILFWWLNNNRHWFKPKTVTQDRPEAPVSKLFDLDVHPESLPEDIAAHAYSLIATGDFRGALSLLYRGMLSRFIQQGRPNIANSATEKECMRLVDRTRSEQESAYFRELTYDWIRLAYGHIEPNEQRMLDLIHRWRVVDES